MLGTTHATNAVLERRKLHRVAVIRIGAPATLGVRPMFEWPADLTAVVSAGAAVVPGGIEFDGRDLSPFDDGSRRGVPRIGRRALRRRGNYQRLRAGLATARAARRRDRQARTRRGAGVAQPRDRLGRPARAGERHHSQRRAGGRRRRCRRGRSARRWPRTTLSPVTFFAQNDGTLMALDHALRYPVLTIGSGPGQQHPRRRVPDRAHRRAGSRCRRHLDRRRRAGERVPQGVLAGRGDRRYQDQLPDARPGDDRARRRDRAGTAAHRRFGSDRRASGTGCRRRRWSSAATRRLSPTARSRAGPGSAPRARAAGPAGR